MVNGVNDEANTPELLESNGFVRLIVDAMLLRRFSVAELSRKASISRSRLSRVLNCRAQIEPSMLQRLFAVLDIDMPRATLAITRFGDWRRYYDPDIEIISGLIDHLPEQLAVAREGCERSPISPNGLKVIAGRVDDLVAGNDRLVVEHRESFMFAGR